jgi:hypothetical protein
MQPENFWGINTNMEKIYLSEVSDFVEGLCFTSNWAMHYWKVLSVRGNTLRLAVYDNKTDEFQAELDWNVEKSDLGAFYIHGDAPEPVKYGKIIMKIKQMDERRKELGYAF